MSAERSSADVLARELAYHEKLYSGFAQQHFARPAVRALREHLVEHILRVARCGAEARVLSIGCGIGDTEILMAPYVREITGVDLSPSAIRQARLDAERAGLRNLRFVEGTIAALEPAAYDLVIAIFFLHHLSDAALAEVPHQVAHFLPPGGFFYSLDPSRQRLSGAVGSRLFPGLMKKYQTPDERELDAAETAALFAQARARYDCRWDYYDFLSTPLAGLLPGWRFGYRCSRRLDNLLIRAPGIRRLGSNFELIARKSR